MIHPRQQLLQIQRITTRALDSWRAFETTCADLATTDTHHLGIHGGDTPDPTYAAQLSHAAWDETAAQIAEALGILKAVDRRIADTAIQHPDTARHIDAAVRGARCSDLDCDELAVKHGHCFTHWPDHRENCPSCKTGAA